MSNNLSPEAKKLAIKSELLRHLTTVEKQLNENKPSSVAKLFFLGLEIETYFKFGDEPDLQRWDNWLKE